MSSTGKMNTKYNINSDTYTNARDLPTPRGDANTVVMNDKIYVIGGWSANTDGFIDVFEVYDPKTDSWSTRTPIVFFLL